MSPEQLPEDGTPDVVAVYVDYVQERTMGSGPGVSELSAEDRVALHDTLAERIIFEGVRLSSSQANAHELRDYKLQLKVLAAMVGGASLQGLKTMLNKEHYTGLTPTVVRAILSSHVTWVTKLPVTSPEPEPVSSLFVVPPPKPVKKLPLRAKPPPSPRQSSEPPVADVAKPKPAIIQHLRPTLANKPSEDVFVSDSLRLYMNRIQKVPLLNAAEEVELAKQIEAGLFAQERLEKAEKGEMVLDPQMRRDLQWVARAGMRAKNDFIEANLRWVVKLAYSYLDRMPLLDLIQEGNLGLMHAVEKFDYTTGNKFSTYATWWIRQSIDRAIGNQARTIRIPIHVLDKIKSLSSVTRELLQRFGREPTTAEIAQEMYSNEEEVLDLQDLRRIPISLDKPLGEDGDARLGDIIEDTEAQQGGGVVLRQAMEKEIQAVLATLTAREAVIMRLRLGFESDYGQPLSPAQIARTYGLTTEQVRQIEAKTIAKLSHPARSGRLFDYWQQL